MFYLASSAEPVAESETVAQRTLCFTKYVAVGARPYTEVYEKCSVSDFVNFANLFLRFP